MSPSPQFPHSITIGYKFTNEEVAVDLEYDVPTNSAMVKAVLREAINYIEFQEKAMHAQRLQQAMQQQAAKQMVRQAEEQKIVQRILRP